MFLKGRFESDIKLAIHLRCYLNMFDELLKGIYCKNCGSFLLNKRKSEFVCATSESPLFSDSILPSYPFQSDSSPTPI